MVESESSDSTACVCSPRLMTQRDFQCAETRTSPTRVVGDSLHYWEPASGFQQHLGLSVPLSQGQSVRGSFCFGDFEEFRESWGSLWGTESRGMCAEGRVSQAHRSPVALTSPGALRLGVRLLQAQPLTPLGSWHRCGQWELSSCWCPWFRAAGSAENLKPIIKLTVSQSAFYYTHASNSKQCQW